MSWERWCVPKAELDAIRADADRELARVADRKALMDQIFALEKENARLRRAVHTINRMVSIAVRSWPRGSKARDETLARFKLDYGLHGHSSVSRLLSYFFFIRDRLDQVLMIDRNKYEIPASCGRCLGRGFYVGPSDAHPYVEYYCECAAGLDLKQRDQEDRTTPNGKPLAP